MPGVRVHHVEKRSCPVEVIHPERLTPKGPKTYRIDLDGEGDALVSPGVWTRMQEAYGLLGYCPFLVMNEVREPPTQRMEPELLVVVTTFYT